MKLVQALAMTPCYRRPGHLSSLHIMCLSRASQTMWNTVCGHGMLYADMTSSHVRSRVRDACNGSILGACPTDGAIERQPRKTYLWVWGLQARGRQGKSSIECAAKKVQATV